MLFSSKINHRRLLLLEEKSIGQGANFIVWRSKDRVHHGNRLVGIEIGEGSGQLGALRRLRLVGYAGFGNREQPGRPERGYAFVDEVQAAAQLADQRVDTPAPLRLAM